MDCLNGETTKKNKKPPEKDCFILSFQPPHSTAGPWPHHTVMPHAISPHLAVVPLFCTSLPLFF